MKKTLLLITLTLFSVSASFAQWTTTGTHISNSNAGNVGIGTTSPSAGFLEIAKPALGSAPLLAFSVKDGTYEPRVIFSHVTTASRQYFQFSSLYGSLIGTADWAFMRGHVGINNTDPGAAPPNGWLTSTNSYLLAVNSGSTSTDAGIKIRRSDDLLGLDIWQHGGSGGQAYIDNLWNNNAASTIFRMRTASGTPLTAMVISANGGRVGIGTTAPDELLSVKGNIHAQEIKVNTDGWPDYVFSETYVLPALGTVEKYIDRYHRLPEMPSEATVAAEGIKLGEMNKLLTKKMEELTLYLIQQDKQLKKQQKEINSLKRKVVRK